MASSSLTLYRSSTTTEAFSLVASSQTSTVWKAANRSLSTPYEVELSRKITSGTKNDHVLVRIARKERNANTSQLATAQLLLDVSVPKDQSILNPGEIVNMLGCLCSLLNDGTANAATTVNRTAIADGRDV